MPEHIRKNIDDTARMDDLLASRVARAKGSVTEKSLPSDVRSDFESRSGYSADNVRVVESDLPQATYANAVTQGNTIHFPRGGYDPGSAEGKRVLMHELGHTVQQAQGQVRANRAGIINDSPALEQGADMAFSGAAPAADTAAPAAAPAAMPTASAGAPMQRDGTPLDEILRQSGVSRQEYLDSLHWWQRRKLLKKEEKAEDERKQKLFDDTVRRMESKMSAGTPEYVRHLASLQGSLSDPEEKGISKSERKERRMRRKNFDQIVAADTKRTEEALVQALGGASNDKEKKKLLEAIRAARQRNQQADLEAQMKKTRTVKRLTDTDALGTYDEKTRKFVADGGAITASTPALMRPAPLIDPYNDSVEAGQQGMARYEKLGQDAEEMNKAASVMDKLSSGIETAGSSGESVHSAHQKLLGVDGAASYEAFSNGPGGAIVGGGAGMLSAFGAGLDTASSVYQARQSAVAGDRAGQTHHALDAASKGTGTVETMLSAFGEEGLGGVTSLPIPEGAAMGLGLVKSGFGALRSGADVYYAHQRKKAHDAVLQSPELSQGYNSEDSEMVDAYEGAVLGRHAAKKDEAVASVELASAVLDMGGNVANLVPGGQVFGTALKGLSKAGMGAKFLTNKGMEKRSRNRVLGGLMESDDVQQAMSRVNTTTLDSKSKEKALAHAANTESRKGLFNKIAGRQAILRHQAAADPNRSEMQTELLGAEGFTDMEKVKNVPLSEFNKRMGGTTSVQEAMADPQAKKRAAAEAEEAKIRARAAKIAEEKAKKRDSGQAFSHLMERTMETARDESVKIPAPVQPRQPVVRPMSNEARKKKEEMEARRRQHMDRLNKYGIAPREKRQKGPTGTPTLDPKAPPAELLFTRAKVVSG